MFQQFESSHGEPTDEELSLIFAGQCVDSASSLEVNFMWLRSNDSEQAGHTHAEGRIGASASHYSLR